MAKSHCCHKNRDDEIFKTKDSCKKKEKHCCCNEIVNEPAIDPICCVKADPIFEAVEDIHASNNHECALKKEDFCEYLNNYLGQTVTIFTTSGGQSGSGFTGVLMSIECDFLRLLSQIGPAPGCALGNCCSNFSAINVQTNFQPDNKLDCSVSSIGSVVVIPLKTIAAFVHNAVGSSL